MKGTREIKKTGKKNNAEEFKCNKQINVKKNSEKFKGNNKFKWTIKIF